MNNNSEPTQGVQITIQDIMKDFATRKSEGKIRWNTDGPTPVLEVDVFDVSGTKQPEPVRMEFSSKQVERILLDYDNEIIAQKRDLLNREERLEALEAERNTVYGTLKNELKALDAKKGK